MAFAMPKKVTIDVPTAPDSVYHQDAVARGFIEDNVITKRFVISSHLWSVFFVNALEQCIFRK